MKKFEDIDRNLKIGPSCIHMNISGIYEGMNALYLSLAYTNMDFIYNKSKFTEFKNPQEPKFYISKDNDLVIAKGIDSVYMDDIDQYLELFSFEIDKPDIKEIKIDKKIDWDLIKKDYLDRDIPVMYVCDHYYTYEDYKKITNEIMHFHTSGHMAVLHNIDFENNTADIVDKFYRFKGKISFENLVKSVESEHLHKNKFEVMNFQGNNFISEKEGFLKYFRKNFEKTLEEKINIHGTEYLKNKEAIVQFCDDFEETVIKLYEQKGKYAPQFLSKLITPTILQKISFRNILEYAIKLDDVAFYRELRELSVESTKYWIRIDQYNDKYYLEGKSILDKMEKYEVILEKIREIDCKIYFLMESYILDLI